MVVVAFLLGIALRGFLYRKVTAPLRVLLIVCAGLLFLDHHYLGGGGYWFNIFGAAAGLAIIGLERRWFRKTIAG